MNDSIFSKIVSGELPSHKVLENEHALAFFDINPIVPYHTLVIPKQHYINMFDVPDAVLRETISLVRRVCKLYEEKLGIDSIQIFNNNGPNGQQEVYHLHYHVCPRQPGDGKNLRFPKGMKIQDQFPEMLAKLR